MSFYKKAVVWLGLNEEYPDSAESAYGHAAEGGGQIQAGNAVDAAPQRRVGPGSEAGRMPERTGPRPQQVAPRARVEPEPKDPLAHNAARDRSEGTVRAIPMDEGIDVTPMSDGMDGSASGVDSMSGDSSMSVSPTGSVRSADALGGTVRAVPVPATTKPSVIVPQSFNDAQNVADMYRDSKPVIVNMQSAERDLARRLIDFSSGLCYGLGGQMEKVAKDVYLLTPSDVEVAEEDRDNF